MNRRRPAWLLDALVVALLAAVFVPISIARLVDADEGTYLLVSRLTMEGRLLYHEVHYPQMPLLPHVYGLWMWLFGPSWYAGRVLSSVFAVLLGWLLFRHVARLTADRALGALAALVLASSTLAFAWYSTVKTFALGTLLLFAAYSVLYEPALRRWRYVASGLLLGFATDVRLYVLVIAPLIAASALLGNRRWKDRLLDLAGFLGGLTLALLPNAYYALFDGELFLFNIVGHHMVRSEFGLVGWFAQKLDVVLLLLGLEPSEDILSFQFDMLLVLDVALVATLVRLRERPPLALAVAAVLILASFVPTPVYTQYFTMVLPFMIVTACLFVARARAELAATAPPALRRGFAYLLAAVFAAYVIPAPLEVYRYTADGTSVPGIHFAPDARNWTIPTIRQVGRAVDELMPAGRDVALSFWPGYFVETRTRMIHGLENHFAPLTARAMTADAARRRQLMSYADIIRHLEQRTVPVVVLGNWSNQLLMDGRARYRAALERGGYTVARKFGDTELYTLPRNGT